MIIVVIYLMSFHEQVAVEVKLPVAVVMITNMVSNVYFVTAIILAASDHVIQYQGHVTAERVWRVEGVILVAGRAGWDPV